MHWQWAHAVSSISCMDSRGTEADYHHNQSNEGDVAHMLLLSTNLTHFSIIHSRNITSLLHAIKTILPHQIISIVRYSCSLPRQQCMLCTEQWLTCRRLILLSQSAADKWFPVVFSQRFTLFKNLMTWPSAGKYYNTMTNCMTSYLLQLQWKVITNSDCTVIYQLYKMLNDSDTFTISTQVQNQVWHIHYFYTSTEPSVTWTSQMSPVKCCSISPQSPSNHRTTF